MSRNSVAIDECSLIVGFDDYLRTWWAEFWDWNKKNGWDEETPLVWDSARLPSDNPEALTTKSLLLWWVLLYHFDYFDEVAKLLDAFNEDGKLKCCSTDSQ